jgi:hypothetical protein
MQSVQHIEESEAQREGCNEPRVYSDPGYSAHRPTSCGEQQLLLHHVKFRTHGTAQHKAAHCRGNCITNENACNTPIPARASAAAAAVCTSSGRARQ